MTPMCSSSIFASLLVSNISVARSNAFAGPFSLRQPMMNSSRLISPLFSTSMSSKRPLASERSRSIALKTVSICESIMCFSNSGRCIIPVCSSSVLKNTSRKVLTRSTSLSRFAVTNAESTNTPVTTLSMARTEKAMYKEKSTPASGWQSSIRGSAIDSQSMPPVIAPNRESTEIETEPNFSSNSLFSDALSNTNVVKKMPTTYMIKVSKTIVQPNDFQVEMIE
mmetsp:Transcript_79198/g.144925  ORF Transcript_79198/g.144925 Transcript_79198/m.144925 type:complete len:224 (+) Transcript_79198:139-810(+)